MALQRLKPTATGKVPCSGPLESGSWGSMYPILVEWLTLTLWEDNSTRATGTILLFAEDGSWKAALHDRDAGMSCFVSGKSPGDLLAKIELGLRETSLEWRTKTQTYGKRK